MRYQNGSTATLGDVVNVGMPAGIARGRIVMLGDTYEHLDIDHGFLWWVNKERILTPNQIVVEWIDANPLAHDDPRYAPADNYAFISLCSCDKRA